MNDSIWVYPDRSREVNVRLVTATNCVFCGTLLETLRKSTETCGWFGEVALERTWIKRCSACGWWTVCKGRDYKLEAVDPNAPLLTGQSYDYHGACGSLRELDLTHVEIPLAEVRNYLAAKYDRRFTMAPRLFEDVVESVFKDIGYDVAVTGYYAGGAGRGDDGIDVLLRGSDGDEIGVQVKRYRNAIKVEQIRALAGALVLTGRTKGIFVTTSRFQKGATATTKRLDSRGYQIELIDAARFYNILKLAQMSAQEELEEDVIASWLEDLTRVGQYFTPFPDIW